jgi:tRNA(Ile)-lysidine synthase TilS/MesJ
MRPHLHYAQWCDIGHRTGDAVREAHEGPALIRPLLRVERAAILAYCSEYGLEPRHDLTNDSPDYLRNRVRGYIIPLLKTYNSNIVGALGRTAGICADEDALLAELLDREWPMLAKEGDGSLSLDRQACDRLHRALLRRALRRAVVELARGVELSADHLDRMMYLVAQPQGRLQLPGGLSIRTTRELIILEQVEA